MTRILHIIPGLGLGGAEHILLHWVRALPAPRFAHRVLALARGGPVAPALREAGAEVHVLGLPLHMGGIVAGLQAWRASPADVVQGWLYHGNLAALAWARARATRPKVVWGIHNSRDWYDFKASTRYVARLCGPLSHRATRVLYVAQSSLAEHVARGFCRHNARYLPGCVDTRTAPASAAERQAARQALGLPGAPTPVIGMLARLHPMKDHATFVAAAAALPDAHFVLAGAGLERLPHSLAARVPPSLAARIHCLGPRQDVPRILAALDICTLSSRRAEALPMVLLEAMAAGVACVATDVGDCTALLADVGHTVPPNDAPGLARAWQQSLAAQAQVRDARLRAGRARVERDYSRSAMAERATALYGEILGADVTAAR